MNKLPIHHRSSSGIKSFVNILLLSSTLLCCSSITDAFAASPASPDKLVLRSRSSFSMSELSLDFSQNGVVKFRACPDSSGCSKDACETSQKKLSTEEFQTLIRLARDAKLFSGPASGSQVDFSFRWLEVYAGNDIAILVTTLNDSFSEPGPRKELLDRLETLDEEMANHNKEKRPR